MGRMLLGGGTVLAAMLAAGAASAQQPLKVGVVMSYSGQFADPGAQIDNGIKLYMKQNGDTVAARSN
jgi:branched-chain amino acid transport system substrate-binding protein